MAAVRGGPDAEVIVVGLGVLGSATAWQLARRGVRVLGLERFELGHVRGATPGDGRIVRRSYRTPAYVAGAIEAYLGWADLAAETGRSLLLECGGVDVFPPGAAGLARSYTDSLAACDVPFELLDAGGARHRWPAMAFPDGATVLYQDRTGVAPADLGAQIMQRRAVARGAQLRRGHEVVELDDTGGEVEVSCADGRTFRAGSVVVTVDAWTNRVLACLDVELPLTVTKDRVVHFDVADRQARYAPAEFPAWNWLGAPGYFGFPAYDDPSIKVGQDSATDGCGGPEPNGSVDGLARLRDFVAGFIPGADRVAKVSTCLYTLTPDRDVVVGPVPGHERVLIGLGSAHGSKVAPWLGRILADLAVNGSTAFDIRPFAVERPGLTAPAGLGGAPGWRM